MLLPVTVDATVVLSKVISLCGPKSLGPSDAQVTRFEVTGRLQLTCAKVPRRAPSHLGPPVFFLNQGETTRGLSHADTGSWVRYTGRCHSGPRVFALAVHGQVDRGRSVDALCSPTSRETASGVIDYSERNYLPPSRYVVCGREWTRWRRSELLPDGLAEPSF